MKPRLDKWITVNVPLKSHQLTTVPVSPEVIDRVVEQIDEAIVEKILEGAPAKNESRKGTVT